MVLQYLLNLFVGHVSRRRTWWGCSSSHFSALLSWLARLLSSVWLTLRSCWYDVSVECCDARRHRRLSEGLTLCCGLLKERRLSTGCPWLSVIDLPQRVPSLTSGRHIVLSLLRRRRVLCVRVGRLRLFALLCVVGLVGRGLERRWWGKLLLRRRRSELLQLLRINVLSLLHNLRNLARCLRVLQLGLLLRRRTDCLRWLLLLLLKVLARVRLRRGCELLLLVVDVLGRRVQRGLPLGLLLSLLLLVLVVALLLR